MSEEGEGLGKPIFYYWLFLLFLIYLFYYFFFFSIGRSPRVFILYVYKCTYKMMLTHPFVNHKQQDKRRLIYKLFLGEGDSRSVGV